MYGCIPLKGNRGRAKTVLPVPTGILLNHRKQREPPGRLILVSNPHPRYNGGYPVQNRRGTNPVATFTFDTHRAIQNLKESGVSEAQAEAVVALVSSVFSDNVATKADIQRLEQKLEYEVRSIRSDMQATEQRAKADNRAMEQRIILKIVAILIPCFGLLFAALRFIP